MNALIVLIPVALLMGLLGLCGFLWALRSGQFEDLDGAAMRILNDPAPDPKVSPDTPGQPPTSAQGE